ncbi:caspase family protein [Streptomyces sp. WAC 04229]|uniref:caspase family protein n=1 Tax=Streptomyces sp. WAC 04229 TaxID=2203206 RepID=UPI003D763657
MSASARLGHSGHDDEPRRFLIATAVSRYPKCPEWDRPGLVEARNRIIELFTVGLGYRHETALGLDPARAQLTDQLRAFCKSPDRRKDDLLAVYVSGHGEVLDDGGEHMLLTADTDPEDIAYTALPTAELARAILRDTSVRRLLLILDTCYSGQGGNELAAAALKRVNAGRRPAGDSGMVIISSAQPHQQAQAGVFPRLLAHAVESWATAGHGPRSLPVSTVVQQMNDHRDRPAFQRISLALVGLTGEPPAFFTNPRHSTVLTDVDLAVQQAAQFEEQARRRDTELSRRLLVRAMGYHDDTAPGWWFCGRHAALAASARWLRAFPVDGPAATVVTAGPGSGKTAVLGLLATLTHPERHRSVPLDSLGLDLSQVPGPGSVDVAMYAQNLTDTDVLQGLAAAAHVRADTVGELLGALEDRSDGRPFTALIDALDEAATPDTLCSQVLRPLIDHSDGRIRLLLGTRPYLLNRLGARRDNAVGHCQVIDLDDPQYADPQALTAYTVRTLLESHRDSPYRGCPDVLRPVAEAVAAAAGTSFLVARITAGTLAADAEVVPDPEDRAWQDGLPRHAGEAMRDDLAGRLGGDSQRAADLLRPLAFAQGQGLPWEDIWAPVATAVSGRPYTDEDLVWLRHAAGSYVVEATEAGRSAYRLYHQALVEYLQDGFSPQPVHAAFTWVLNDRVPRGGDGTRDWSRAHPYLLAHLAVHAAEAGLMDQVVRDPEYLVHATPRGLTPHLHGMQSDPARLIAAVYRTSLSIHADAAPAVRRQVLALDAARADATHLHEELSSRIPVTDWTPDWATGSGFTLALRDTLTGHAGGVTAVACSDLGDGPVAVTGDTGGWVRLWDLRTGIALGEPLTADSGAVSALACTSVDGVAVVITGGDDGAVRVWDLRTGNPLAQLLGKGRRVTALACSFADDGPVVAACDGDEVRVWGLRTGAALPGLPGGHRYGGANWTVKSSSLHGTPVIISGTEDGTVTLMAMNSMAAVPRSPRFQGHHNDGVVAVACTVVDGTPVSVTGGGRLDGTVRVTDLRTGTAVFRPLAGHTGGVSAVDCAVVEGTPIAVTCGSFDGALRVWDLRTGFSLGEPLIGHTGGVSAAACSVVEDTAVAVTGGDDGMARVWDLRTSTVGGRQRVGHTGVVSALTCTEVDGSPVAVTAGGIFDGAAWIWDLRTGRAVGEPLGGHPDGVLSVGCAEVEGTPVALTCGRDGAVRVWDLRTHAVLRGTPLALADGVSVVACCVVNGVPVAVTGGGRLDGQVRMWDMRNGTAMGEPSKGHTGGVSAMACAVVDGSPVAVTGGHLAGGVRVWDVPTGHARGRALSGPTGGVSALACTSVDGTPVAFTGGVDGRAQLWDLREGHAIGESLPAHARTVAAVACTVVDGVPFAATCSAQDNMVRIWNLRSAEPVNVLRLPSPHALAFTSDGALVVGISNDVAVLSRRSRYGT